MKTQKQLYIVQIPPVSNEFALHLAKVFRPVKAEPGMSMDTIQRSAAQQEIIEYVKRAASGTSISGDVNDLKQTEHTGSLLNKLLGFVRK